MQFIRRAQTVGFTLREIEQLLALRDNPDATRQDVRDQVQQKIADVDARLRELQQIRGDLLVTAGPDSLVNLHNDVKVGGLTEIESRGEVTAVGGQATVPNFAAASFTNSTNINNPYFPVVPGAKYKYLAEVVDEDTGEISTENIIVEMLAQTKVVAGVQVRIVRDRVFEDGRIVEANRAAIAAYGYDRETLLTKTIYDLRDPDSASSVDFQMHQADSDGVLFESFHRRADGTLFPVEVSSRGALVSVFASSVDSLV